jgi:hypothetical protein
MTNNMTNNMTRDDNRGHLSRRGFVQRAAGTGLAVAAAVGAAGATAAAGLLTGCSSDEEDELASTVANEAGSEANITTLDVATGQILETTDFDEAPLADYLVEGPSWELTMGTQVFQASASTALLLQPADVGEDLVGFALLNLDDGTITSLFKKPVGLGVNDILYDARASETSLIWVELNLASQDWRVYVAPMETILTVVAEVTTQREAAKGPLSPERVAREAAEAQAAAQAIAQVAQLVEEGNADYEAPMLAISGDKAYWTVMPNPDGPASTEDSYLKAVQVRPPGSFAEPQTVHTSHGRMITTPLISGDLITIVPRVDTESIYYQLTAITVLSNQIRHVDILPQSLRVTDAVFLGDNFAFCIEDNYDYAKGLATFGTYLGLPDGTYLHVNRIPTSAPVMIDGLLFVKSTMNAVCFDVTNHRYFAVKAVADCVDYGDVLAGWGVQNRLVLYTSVPNHENSSKSKTVLRVFDRPAPPEPEVEEGAEEGAEGSTDGSAGSESATTEVQTPTD